MKEKQWYIDQHRKMWNWIADRIEKAKRSQNIIILKLQWCNLNDVIIKGSCFACQYAVDKEKDCYNGCLFNWSDLDDFVWCMDGYFQECLCSFSWQEQAELARKIANLPVREDV